MDDRHPKASEQSEETAEQRRAAYQMPYGDPLSPECHLESMFNHAAQGSRVQATQG